MISEARRKEIQESAQQFVEWLRYEWRNDPPEEREAYEAAVGVILSQQKEPKQ